MQGVVRGPHGRDGFEPLEERLRERAEVAILVRLRHLLEHAQCIGQRTRQRRIVRRCVAEGGRGEPVPEEVAAELTARVLPSHQPHGALGPPLLGGEAPREQQRGHIYRSQKVEVRLEGALKARAGGQPHVSERERFETCGRAGSRSAAAGRALVRGIQAWYSDVVRRVAALVVARTREAWAAHRAHLTRNGGRIKLRSGYANDLDRGLLCLRGRVRIGRMLHRAATDSASEGSWQRAVAPCHGASCRRREERQRHTHVQGQDAHRDRDQAGPRQSHTHRQDCGCGVLV